MPKGALSATGPSVIGAIGALAAVAMIAVGAMAFMWPVRPMVDYRIVAPAHNEPPSRLDFTSSRTAEFSFEIRNRGGSDAPSTVRIEVFNAYIGQKVINGTSIVFYTNIEAHSENYGYWLYSIAPIMPPTGDMYPSEIQIKFGIEKSMIVLTASGIENSLLGEYNGYYSYLVYREVSSGIYQLV